MMATFSRVSAAGTTLQREYELDAIPLVEKSVLV